MSVLLFIQNVTDDEGGGNSWRTFNGTISRLAFRMQWFAIEYVRIKICCSSRNLIYILCIIVLTATRASQAVNIHLKYQMEISRKIGASKICAYFFLSSAVVFSNTKIDEEMRIVVKTSL